MGEYMNRHIRRYKRHSEYLDRRIDTLTNRQIKQINRQTDYIFDKVEISEKQ